MPDNPAGSDQVQTIKEIIAELCAETNSRQFPSEITSADVMPYIDSTVVCEWAAKEVNTSTYPTLIQEAIDLTEADAARFLATILNDTHTARDIIAASIRTHVARYIAKRANSELENFDPSDAQMSRSYASWVDDPVRSDRLALARAR